MLQAHRYTLLFCSVEWSRSTGPTSTSKVVATVIHTLTCLNTNGKYDGNCLFWLKQLEKKCSFGGSFLPVEQSRWNYCSSLLNWLTQIHCVALNSGQWTQHAQLRPSPRSSTLSRMRVCGLREALEPIQLHFSSLQYRMTTDVWKAPLGETSLPGAQDRPAPYWW